MKQRPHYVVGIDVAADTFAATALSSPDHQGFLKEQVANTPEGFAELCSELDTHGISADQVVIVLEATGVYGEPLCYFFDTKGYKIAVEPPNEVKKAFKSRRKTDPVDSQQIAEYGYRFFDKLHFWEPKAEILEQIHSVLTTRELLTKQLTAHRTALHALERKVVKTPVAARMHQKSIRRLVKDIQALDQAIKNFIEQDPELKAKAALAESVPGVGQLLTANLRVMTDGFTQHMNPKSLAAYAGICP